ITRFDVNQGFPGLVAASGEPLVTSDVTLDPRFLRTRVKEKGMRSYISMPLRSGRTVLGCLNIASRRRFDNADLPLQLLAWIAAPLASAAELAILRSQQSVDWLDEGEPYHGDLPGQVLKTMMDTSEADHGMISLWRSGTTEFLFEPSSIDMASCPASRGECDCPSVRGARPIVYPLPGAAIPYACRESLRGSRSAVCLPIGSPGHATGVVSLRFLRPQPVPTRSLALLGAMARTAGRVVREAWPYLTDHCDEAGPAGRSRQGTESRVFPALRTNSNDDRAASPPAKDTIDGLTANDVAARAGGRLLDQGIGNAAQSHEATAFSLKPEPPVSTGPPSLAIRCFGNFQVFRDGNPLTSASFGRRQSLTVLKILVSRKGRSVDADFLLEALWPEAEPGAASKRLWVIMHSLRSTLEPGLKPGQPSTFVQRNGDAYLFNPSSTVQVDVDEFMAGMARGQSAEDTGDLASAAAAYQQAARQYRGDFMEDEPYSDWCSAEREYLRELFLGVLKRLAWIHASWQEWDKSIAWNRRALLVDSLREEVHRDLMRCLRKAGRRDEALRQYLECRRILARELNTEPLPETSRLYQETQQEKTSDWSLDGFPEQATGENLRLRL
ncbi:MAG: BTAD domain-containing putative transcriptional regulator, partial [Dehalococcoidia bacterium]|nr:BTAD domain-containing putative transcriptional regulator [Dehalococcoidia bacterium]